MNFVLLQVAGVLLALWISPAWAHVLLGALLGAWVWWLAWLWQSLRFYLWARQEGVATRRFRGLWGDLQYFWRKQQRKHLREQQELGKHLNELRTAVQASPNGVLLLDADWGIAWINDTGCEHLRLEGKDVGQNLLTLVRDPEFASYCAVGDFREVLEMDGRSTRRKRLAIQIFPYGDGQKLLLSSDITHLKQADAMRRDFIANVSHEIRTPLTIFSGYVETLLSVPMDERQRMECYASMQQQARRMQLLVEDLLTLSRLEGNPLPDLNAAVEVSTLLRRCRDDARALSSMLAPQADSPMHTIRLHYRSAQGQATQSEQSVVDLSALDLPDAHGGEPLPQPTQADPPQLPWPSMGRIAGVEKELHSAFTNLVVNAVRYTPAGGCIDLQWQWHADGGASFSVCDTGPGIAAEHLPRLTERFYRVDLSRSRETGGTGLGLAIVKHVVQRHGGELRIESTPGKGSCFRIHLPATRLQTPEALAQAQAEQERKQRLLESV